MDRFVEKRVPGLLGQTVVFSEANADGSITNDFRILADAGGVRFQGESSRIVSIDELNRFAKTLTEAVKHFDRLRPKITNTAGH